MRDPVVLTVGNVDTFISGGQGLAFPVKAVDDRLSYSLPGSWYAMKATGGRWDGKEHLLESDSFPTGLLPFVEEILKEKGTAYRIVDNREFPEDFQDYNLPGIDLYPHQKIAVAIMLKYKRGVVQVPTAGGKTFICAATIKALNIPCAYIVHTSTLFSQTVEEFRRVGLDVGEYGSGQKTEGKDVTVFMVQTIMAALKGGSLRRTAMARMLDDYQALIVDECHHLSSDGRKASWYIASTMFENASVRLGVSATPQFKKSGMLLMAATGPLIHSVPVTALQQRKIISDSKPTFIDINTPKFPVTWSYHDAYQQGIVENTKRNDIALKLAADHAEQGKLVMIFVDRIEHGNLINSDLYHCGVPYFFLSGMNPREEIENVKRLAKTKEVKILVVTRKLFGEGVDIPAVDVLINLAGGKSATAFIQMFGRGLRRAEGKEELAYYDFFDDTHRYLRDHSEVRLRHCKKLKQDVIRAKEPPYNVKPNEASSDPVAGKGNQKIKARRKRSNNTVR